MMCIVVEDAHAATELNGSLVEGKAPVLQNDLSLVQCLRSCLLCDSGPRFTCFWFLFSAVSSKLGPRISIGGTADGSADNVPLVCFRVLASSCHPRIYRSPPSFGLVPSSHPSWIAAKYTRDKEYMDRPMGAYMCMQMYMYICICIMCMCICLYVVICIYIHIRIPLEDCSWAGAVPLQPGFTAKS